MSKQEAKRWACDMAAALLRSDLDGGEVVREDDSDAAKKLSAMNALIKELERRGHSHE